MIKDAVVRRKRRKAKSAGRPKVMVRCTWCKRKMGVVERRAHEPKCSKRPKAIRREATERKIK